MFKSNFLFRVTHLKDISVSTDLNTAIKKFVLQNGATRECFWGGYKIGFECKNDGTVYIGDYDMIHSYTKRWDRAYFLRAKLVAENGKTVLKVYEFKNRFYTSLQIFAYIVWAIIPLLLVHFLFVPDKSSRVWLSMFELAVVWVVDFYYLIGYKNSSGFIPKNMLEEYKRKILEELESRIKLIEEQNQ